MYQALEYEVQTPTIYDFAKYFIRLLKAKCTIYFKKKGIQLTDEVVEFVKEVNQLLLEMCIASLLDVEFQSKKPSLLAAGHLSNSLILIIDLRKEVKGYH